MSRKTPLANITRVMLEPIWCDSTIPLDEVASRLGVTRSAIWWKARRLGLPNRGKIAAKRGRDEEFRRMWVAGVSTPEMAEHFGYSHKSCVSRRAANMGLPRRSRAKGAGKNNGKGLCGWGGTITLAQYRETEVARRWAESVGRAA